MFIITVRALRVFIALATAIILMLAAIAVIPVFHLMNRYNRVYQCGRNLDRVARFCYVARFRLAGAYLSPLYSKGGSVHKSIYT